MKEMVCMSKVSAMGKHNMYMGKQQERTVYAHGFVFPTNMFNQHEKTITQIQIVGYATTVCHVMTDREKR